MTGARVGRYDVLARLTKGGMAELSLASTAGPGGFRKFVVLKRILPEAAGDENFVRMFLDEARVTGAFSHPSICQVFELGNDTESGLFVAMEFIAGQDLNQVVSACAKQQAVLPVGFSASVVHDCAQALHYAHTFKLPNGESSPVIHRDVAQKNIMVTYDGQVKLLDFGIAKAKGALSRTRAGTVKGTAGYMSPEQVRGEQIDGRSDVFALGVVLWEMITGRRLFSADTELAELKMILSEPIVPPHEVEPSVPEELSAVAMKALERDVNQRYRTAREMAKALSGNCAHLLFDAEERAEFMGQRFAEKIESAKKLFDVAASTNESEVDAAVEAFRRSSQHGNDEPTPQPSRPKKAAMSAAKLKPVRSQQSLNRVPAVPSVSSTKLKKMSASRLPKHDPDQYAATEAQVLAAPPPKEASGKVWLIAVALFVAFVALASWKLMEPPPGPPEGVTTGIPGVESPEVQVPGVEAQEPPQVTAKPEEPLVPTTPKEPARGKGEVTLVFPDGATVFRGKEVLGSGKIVKFSLPTGTHLLTVVGDDGVKRKLSTRVTVGKNAPQKYSLENLPIN